MAKYNQDFFVKEKKYKNRSTLGKILRNPILYSTLALGTAIFAYVNHQTKETPENEYAKLTEQIENNISSVYGFKNFQLQSFKGTTENSKYYIKLIGNATKIPGQAANYAGLKYQVDEKIHTIITTASGNAQEDYDNILYVLSYLTFITKQKAENFEQVQEQAQHGYSTLGADNFNTQKDETFVLTNLTAPTVNTLTNTISFEIQAITSQELNEQDEQIATLKTYTVSAELTPELIANPDFIYNQYTNGQTNFKLSKEEQFKIQNFDMSMLNFEKSNSKNPSIEL